MIDEQESLGPQNVTRRRFIKRSGGATVGTAIGLYALQSPVWGQQADDSSFGMVCAAPSTTDHPKNDPITIGQHSVSGTLSVKITTRKKDPDDTPAYNNDTKNFKFEASIVVPVQANQSTAVSHSIPPQGTEFKRSYNAEVTNATTGSITSKEVPHLGGPPPVPKTFGDPGTTQLTIGGEVWYLEIQTERKIIGQNQVQYRAKAVLKSPVPAERTDIEGSWSEPTVVYTKKAK